MRLGTSVLMIVLCILIVLAVFSVIIRDFIVNLCEKEDEETVKTTLMALNVLRSGKLPSMFDKNVLNTNFSELIRKMNCTHTESRD